MDSLPFLANLSFIWKIGVPFLVALTVLIFVHELGHYLVARWCKVKVEVFSLGFGTELKGWTDRTGTRWKICAVPLGGYVKMFGESSTVEDDETKEPRPMTAEEKSVSFHHKTLLQRAAIVVAGPAVNYIFAAIAFAALFVVAGVPQTDPNEPLPAVVGGVSAGSPAAQAGFQAGDKVINIGGEPITLFTDLQRVIRANPGVLLPVTVERGGSEVALKVVPSSQETTDRSGAKITVGQLGVSADPGKIEYVRQPFVKSIWLGIERCYIVSARILGYIHEVFAGRQSADEVGGILRIAQMSGQVAETGLANYITFLAVLSVNLGLINLFPVPLLDGGHLAFYAIEAVRGRPLGQRAQEYGFRIGLVLVVALFLFATWNDLVHLKFFEFIANLFT
jgi:regulator of sigma E protease